MIVMSTRRSFLVSVACAASLAAMVDFFRPKSQMKVMFTNPSLRPRGPANRSLAALEETWIKMRFHAEAMMEDGRVSRDAWERTKLNTLHGNFDIRDPANGELLQKVVNGVRVPSQS
jgi:hypothetical protein